MAVVGHGADGGCAEMTKTKMKAEVVTRMDRMMRRCREYDREIQWQRIWEVATRTGSL
jgi:hypothetical protein